MAKFLKEFREFSLKGNMVDIAVGMILGAAFNGVINTLVTKVLMPPLSFLMVNENFLNSKLILRNAVLEGGKVIKEQIAVEYGVLIIEFVNFLIVALCIFFVVKVSNKIRSKSHDPEDAVVPTPEDIKLLNDLKAIMKEQNELIKKHLEKETR